MQVTSILAPLIVTLLRESINYDTFSKALNVLWLWRSPDPNVLLDTFIIIRSGYKRIHPIATRVTKLLDVFNKLSMKFLPSRFRKQLMHLYIVHPTFLVKAIFTLARPFIR